MLPRYQMGRGAPDSSSNRGVGASARTARSGRASGTMVSHDQVLTAWVAIAAVTFPFLFTTNAPYGKFFAAGWGPKMPGGLGWFLQEIPSPIFLWLGVTRGSEIFPEFAKGGSSDPAYVRALVAVWFAHYAHRAVVYPLTRSLGPTAWITVSSAVAFNVVNGILVGSELAYRGQAPANELHLRYAVVAFVLGVFINVYHDAKLRRLRATAASAPESERSGRYVMPRGGLFYLVACPHYLGELIEWTAFAALCPHVRAARAFAFWTFANLYPRAAATARWYRETFPRRYPARCRAMIPFI